MRFYLLSLFSTLALFCLSFLPSFTIGLGCSPLNSTIAPHWCPKGHSATAAIAQVLLTDRTQQALNVLLPAEGGQLEPLSSWPDDVRNSPQWSWSAGLHFINTPAWQCDYHRETNCQDSAYPGQDWCVDGAIVNYTKRTAGADDPFHAIIFLTHFLGDIHQPLHVSFASDWGGNKIAVTYLNQSTELHLVWDDDLINTRVNRDFQNSYYHWKSYLIGTLQNISSSQVQAWLKCPQSSVGPYGSCSLEWGRESAKLACTNAYSHVNGSKIVNHDVLGEDYYVRNIALVEQRILQGGIRLAHILNSIFDPQSAAENPTLAFFADNE